jgi:hypothetical protein
MTDDDFAELWGTFSVRDHLQPCAFVADVLLYDRLVVPVPPADDPVERQRWIDNRWDPDRQDAILDVLGDLAKRVEWNAERRAAWGADYVAAKERLNRQVARELGLPYQLTGARLFDDVSTMARGINASTPYTSVPEIERALELRRIPPGTRLPGGTLGAVLGTEFIIPADPARSEIELLTDAVKVARSADYTAARAALYRFQQRFIRDDLTDLDAIKAAVERMDRLAADLREATDRAEHWSGLRRVLEFANVAAPLAGALITHEPFAIGQAVIGVGLYAATPRLRDPAAADASVPEAALVVDAGRRLNDL